MTLTAYSQKRSFAKTPEPRGSEQKTAGPLTFVVQKHRASQLHYDFRLELNGVLKSWAIPKGPSLNPNDKRLAMMVEDHPLEYALFEGIIPKGNYGAGAVMVWDQGVYSPIAFVDRKKAEEILSEQLEKGRLAFVLLGKKLIGEFALVRIEKSNNNGWLLIKKNDEYASQEDVLRNDHSVLTNRTLGDIQKQAEKKQEIWPPQQKGIDLKGAPTGNMPKNIEPMLAETIDRPFDKKGWLFEMKWDGYRTSAEIKNGTVKLYSRNNLSYNEKFKDIVKSLSKFPKNAVFDGEVVVVDKNGHPKFQWLQDFPKSNLGELRYYVFDLLYYDHYYVEKLPLRKRKEILKAVLPPLPHLFYSDHIEEQGIAFFNQAEKLGLEGIMAKNENSLYKQGIRTRDWLKIKTHHRQEAIIAGYTAPRGSRMYFGALILGIYKNGKLRYIGHTGGGFDDKQLKTIFEKLKLLKQETCPFEIKPQTNTEATWIKPKLVCEVQFLGWTEDGQMRQPVFVGLRSDKIPSEIEKEKRVFSKNSPQEEVKEVRIGRKKIKLKNLSKIFWPKEGYTKGDLINYYWEIAPFILRYLKDRPQSLLRYPNGIEGESFFQKNSSTLDVNWIKRVKIHSESLDKDIEYLLCQDKESLMYIINLGCIDLNPWNSRVGHLDKPDYLLIDLDPEAVSFDKVIDVALNIRELLEKLEIPSLPKTSGARGLHVYIPLHAQYIYEQVRKFAELLCTQVHAKIPELTSMVRNPNNRQGKVYLDFLQNARGQTLVSAYSLRAKPEAPVSTPLKWSEVNKKLRPSQFTMKNIPRRLDTHGDLFKEVLGKGIDMKKILKKMKENT